LADSASSSARRFDLPESALIFIATGMAFSIFNAFLLDVTGARINAWVVLIATLIELVVLSWFLARGNVISHEVPRVDVLVFAGIVLITTTYMIYPSLPALLPPSHHYDAVHPIVLADFIFQTDSLPHDYTGATPPYFPPGYPVGGATMVALASHWLGRVPIDTLHPLISFVMGLTAGLTFLIIRRVLGEIRFASAIALLATFLLFTAWEYFPGSLNERYFFGQTFAQFFALLTFLLVMNYVRVPSLLTLFLILTSLAAVLFSHPSPLVAPALAVAVVLAERFRHNPRQAVLHGGLLAFGLALVAYFYVLPRWSAWVYQTGYGEAAPFGIESIGVVLPFLAILGFVLAFGAQWRDRCWIGFLMLVAILAQPIALFLGRSALPGIGAYYFEKSVYLLIYPMAIFAAIALAQSVGAVGERLPHVVRGWKVWGTTAIGAVFILLLFPARPFAPLTQSELDVARWAKSNLDTNILGYVSPIREDAYWIQVAVFGMNPSSPSATAAYNLGPMDYDEWRDNPGEPDYAIVRNTSHIPVDPSVTTVYRVDESAVLLKPRAPIAAPPPSQYAADVHFGDMFDLVGYDLAKSSLLSDPMTVTFYWRPLHWPSARVAMFVQVVDSLGNVVARSENEMLQKRYPTQRWPIGSVLTDTWRVPLPAETNAGDYSLEVAVFDNYSGNRFSVRGPEIVPTDRIELGPVRVTIPAPSNADLRSADQVNARFGDEISLLACSMGDRNPSAGSILNLTLYWQRIATVTHDYTVFVHMLNSSGHLVAQVDAPPQNGTYPTSTWQAGEIVKDPYHLKIAKDVPPGDYKIEVGLYTAADLKRLPVAGSDHFILPQPVTVK
jgi:hypothetical protein